MAALREVMERLGAAAYFNGHDHNLQHVVPVGRSGVGRASNWDGVSGFGRIR